MEVFFWLYLEIKQARSHLLALRQSVPYIHITKLLSAPRLSLFCLNYTTSWGWTHELYVTALPGSKWADAGMLAPSQQSQSHAASLFGFPVEDSSILTLAWKHWPKSLGRELSKKIQAHLKYNTDLLLWLWGTLMFSYSGPFLSTYLCLKRFKHFTSLLEATE